VTVSDVLQMSDFQILAEWKKTRRFFCVFAPLSAAGCGGMHTPWSCAFGELDCCLIYFVRLPGMGQHSHYNTPQHTAARCNALEHTLLSTMQIWCSICLAINSTRLLKTPFLSCSPPPTPPISVCIYISGRLSCLMRPCMRRHLGYGIPWHK